MPPRLTPRRLFLHTVLRASVLPAEMLQKNNSRIDIPKHLWYIGFTDGLTIMPDTTMTTYRPSAIHTGSS